MRCREVIGANASRAVLQVHHKNHQLLYRFQELAHQSTEPLASTTLGSEMYTPAEPHDPPGPSVRKARPDLLDVEVAGPRLSVTERKAWCALVSCSVVRPVAPLSGHNATLLRGTVRKLVADHDVDVTDRVNVRPVPLAAGSFDFYGHVDHVRR